MYKFKKEEFWFKLKTIDKKSCHKKITLSLTTKVIAVVRYKTKIFVAKKETIIISESVIEEEEYQKIFWQQDRGKYPNRHKKWQSKWRSKDIIPILVHKDEAIKVCQIHRRE